MKMMDELKHMFLYSADNKVYAPVDEIDKRKNAAILLLTPNIESSSKLMKLPYVYNPNLFVSFYVDRDVMGYVDNSNASDIEDFDEVEEESISESLVKNIISKTDIKFDIDEDSCTSIDRSYIFDVFNKKTVTKLVDAFDIKKIPDKAKVIVHHSISDLRDSAPNNIKSLHHGRFYGYSDDESIHVLSRHIYDQETMYGDYYLYLKLELYNYIIKAVNPNIPYLVSRGLAIQCSGLYEWLENNPNNCQFTKEEIVIAKIATNMVKDKKYRFIADFIDKNDINIFKQYASDRSIAKIKTLVFESNLSSEKRNSLPDDEFGIPSRRAYPLYDEDHVRSAIKMFNYCDIREEKELANAIIRKMKKFNITDINVGEKNRFSKYYKTPKNESIVLESFVNSDYEDIIKICSNLSQDEFKKITFYDTYRDSQFVIKRIIHHEGMDPVGFLDVYHFPSRPEIAQIVIAVDNKYRGQGIARSMVNELLSSNLEANHNFDMYYWTAHQDNYASQSLALSCGFEDTNKIDSYGRKIFIKRVKEKEDYSKDARIHYSESSIITENGSIFLYEADNNSNSNKIKRYLYRERLRNNKSVLDIYDRVRALNPGIRKMYLKLDMYKNFNLYIDLSYYHGLFLQNNTFKLDRGINVYIDFLSKLINNKEINSQYKKRTIFIPVDAGTWSNSKDTDITDFKQTINPISIIFRLVRTNPGTLRSLFGNKDVIFVGTRGYFKVDFSRFEMKDLNRFRINIRKLMSFSEPIVDDFEKDIDSGTDSKKAITAKIIDKIEDNTSIKINNISNIGVAKTYDNKPTHLRITTTPLNLTKQKYACKDIAIVSINPDEVGNMSNIERSPIYKKNLIDIYCVPE